MQNGVIQRWGNSQGLRIPKSILSIANLRENDPVEIFTDGEIITIRKAAPPRTLDDLFMGYQGDFVPCEMEDGGPVGKEVFD